MLLKLGKNYNFILLYFELSKEFNLCKEKAYVYNIYAGSLKFKIRGSAVKLSKFGMILKVLWKLVLRDIKASCKIVYICVLKYYKRSTYSTLVKNPDEEYMNLYLKLMNYFGLIFSNKDEEVGRKS